ncbi:hypothetical protein [Trichocoleus sp. FACHB-262]|uniref:hypothetical protein n=1 Tax=Trichocoleus sp. FACHB-262 TaxID=2692869 RepID=UPI0016865EAB|nr:hypothetical protein [Trichocoleus sp. FACHB-262]MBD2120199.1 hypothetical protein [Trichocoleus sp. FACHB-262]
MPSTSKRPNPDQSKSSPWLSLATVPLLAFLLSGKALAECVQELGQMSEELFRGDRLPNIDFPVTHASNSEISE